MPTYKVASPLSYDNVDFAVDEQVEMPEKEAKGLLEAGVLESLKAKPKPKPKNEDEETTDDDGTSNTKTRKKRTSRSK